MIIDLKRIFANDNSSLPLEYVLDLSSVEYTGVYPLKKPVKLIGAVSNKASLVRLEAEISYEFNAPCDRCGCNVAKEHTLKIDKSLASSIEGDDSDTIIIIPDMKLNIEELVYTEVIVNLPMKHLCSEECKGICSKCGKDLNEGKCDCPVKEIDPRFSALAELLNNESST